MKTSLNVDSRYWSKCLFKEDFNLKIDLNNFFVINNVMLNLNRWFLNPMYLTGLMKKSFALINILIAIEI